VLFGGRDILINNIAWGLRHLPVFGVFGSGTYRVQPIHVADLADLAVAQGGDRAPQVIDAIGPETTGSSCTRSRGPSASGAPIISVPPRLGYLATWLLGTALGDVVLTWDEIQGLMQGLLATDSPPGGHIKFSVWAREHAKNLGRRYASELRRRR
jgi:NADH dehydrogenase